ncbi:MAG: PQQ-binding-like beta-propeller repeat protein, partial [bacterium]
DTGKELWKFETGQTVYSSAAHLGGTVFIGANDGKYYALNPGNGEEKWSVQTKGGIYFSTPAVKDDIVFAAPGDYDRNIYAWKAGDGEPAWKYKIMGSGKILVSSPAADGEVVYINAGYPDVKLYALEQSTGALLWATPAGTATQHGYLSSPAVGSEYLWAGTGDGKLLTIDKASGKIKNEIDLGEPILSSPAITKDKLLIASTEGKLYALW